MTQLGSLSGQRLSNRYLLGDVVGKGSFGEVYEAKDLWRNQPQAIKAILENHLKNPKFRDGFIREAEILATLNNPYIVSINNLLFEGNRLYLVMPFINGGTLQKVLEERGQLSLQDIELYLTQICAALDYLHKQKVVHLDLKPLNLLYQDRTLLLS